jgi:hypothetical protein
MKESQYITPRLGRGSIFILGLMLIAAIALSAAYLRHVGSNTLISDSLAESQFSFLMWLTGMTYGLAAGISWLATIVKSRFLRWAVRAGAVIVLAAAQQHLGTESWLRGLSNLGGLVSCQCMLFHWLGVPNWTTVDPARDTADALGNVQFGIGDIVIATTGIALLLAIAIRYQTPINPLGYWLVLVLFWIVGPLISACTAMSILQQRGMSVGLLAIAILLAVGGVAGLAAAEWLLIGVGQGTEASKTLAINVSLYGRIVLAYLFTFALFGMAAKTDIVVATETEAELDI